MCYKSNVLPTGFRVMLVHLQCHLKKKKKLLIIFMFDLSTLLHFCSAPPKTTSPEGCCVSSCHLLYATLSKGAGDCPVCLHPYPDTYILFCFCVLRLPESSRDQELVCFFLVSVISTSG